MKKWTLVTIVALAVLLAGLLTLAIIFQRKSSSLTRERDNLKSQLAEVRNKLTETKKELDELKEQFQVEDGEPATEIPEAEAAIRSFYGAWGRKDYEAMYSLMSPESIQVEDPESNTRYFQGRTIHDNFIQSVSQVTKVELLDLKRYPSKDIPDENIYYYKIWLDLDLGPTSSIVPPGQREMLQPVQKQGEGYVIFAGEALQ